MPTYLTTGPLLIGHCLTLLVSASPVSLSLLHICSAWSVAFSVLTVSKHLCNYAAWHTRSAWSVAPSMFTFPSILHSGSARIGCSAWPTPPTFLHLHSSSFRSAPSLHIGSARILCSGWSTVLISWLRSLAWFVVPSVHTLSTQPHSQFLC